VDKSLLEDDEDMSGNPEDLEDGEDMVETKVAAGKKLKLEYQVDAPKTQIWYIPHDLHDDDFYHLVYVEINNNNFLAGVFKRTIVRLDLRCIWVKKRRL